MSQQTEHKEIPILFSTAMVQAILAGRKTQTRRVLKVKGCKPFVPISEDWSLEEIKRWNKDYNPYGKPSDVLWVRETHYYLEGDLYYEADRNPIVNSDKSYMSQIKRHPSIFMPKAIARIWLRVKDMRVERLQDISEADAIAEGVEVMEWHEARNHTPNKCAFNELWRNINGRESLEANPWVWVVEFEVLSTTGKPSITV